MQNLYSGSDIVMRSVVTPAQFYVDCSQSHCLQSKVPERSLSNERQHNKALFLVLFVQKNIGTGTQKIGACTK